MSFPPTPPIGTTKLHRCGECGHKAADHLGSVGWGGGDKPRVGFCGNGGCACNLSSSRVEDMNPPVEVPTFSSDRWRG